MLNENPKYNGMSQGNAKDLLLKIVRFELFKKTGKNICYRCGNKIEHYDDMTLDHIAPWRNQPREEALRLISDLDNLAFSHPQCNTNDTTQSESGYIGVVLHNTGCPKSWQARFIAKNKKYSLRYWKTKEQAALYRDLFAFKFYNGCCRLNFKYLVDFYKENINKDWSFVEDEGFVKTLLGRKI